MALGALAVLAVTGVLASSHRLISGERPVFQAVNGLPVWLLWPMRAVMVLGTTGGALAVVALVAAVTSLRAGGRAGTVRRPGSVWRLTLGPMVGSLVTAVVGARVAVEVLKRVVDRNRPRRFPAELPHLHVRVHAAGLGYPSGHATISMALALTLSVWWPGRRWPLVAVAVLVGLGRLYVGVHLPLDVAGGMALGVLASVVGAALGRRLTIGAPPFEPGGRDMTH